MYEIAEILVVSNGKTRVILHDDLNMHHACGTSLYKISNSISMKKDPSLAGTLLTESIVIQEF
jgi:hypothetical protein